jgi:hypothetical protein
MARNFYFSEKVRSEMNLYEDLVIEALKIYGQDLYYLPRHIVNEDTLLGDDPTSKFPTSHKIEMYIDNPEGFDGEGDLFTRFGVEIRDEITLVVSKQRFETQVRRMTTSGIDLDRPAEGDLIWIPLTKKMFEIRHVEHEQPFYQIENLPVYKMRCTLFEYTGEDFDNQIDDIQDIEENFSYLYKVSLTAPKKATASLVQDSDGVVSISLIQGGTYYTYAPTIVFIGGTPIDSATATATVSGGAVTSITLTDSGNYTTDSAITIQFIGGSAIDSAYSIGDSVGQTIAGGVKMSGEIQKITLDSSGDSSIHLYLSNVGADDGKFHTFITGADVINNTLSATTGLTASAVTEINNLSATEQNDEFTKQYIDDFIDFSEDNPFGDPENQ